MLNTGKRLAAGVVLASFVCAGSHGVNGPASAQDAPEEPAEKRPLQARVDEAIDKSVLWLRSIQREDGTFVLGPDSGIPLPAGARRVAGGSERGDPSESWAGGPWDKGLDALCLYALAVSDVPADDPAMEKGFEALRRHWAGRPSDANDVMVSAEGVSTYFVSLCLLALDAQHNRGVGALSQGPANPKKTGAKLFGKRDYAWACEMMAWLELAQDGGADAPSRGASSKKKKRKKRPRPPKSSSPPSPSDGGGFSYDADDHSTFTHDHSNTQFALLGMKAAARLGVEVPEVMWLRSLRHFIATQEKEGPEVARVDALDAGVRTGKTSDVVAAIDQARGWTYLCTGSRYDASANNDSSGARSLLDRVRGSMTTGGVSSLVICRSELIGVKGFTNDLQALTETAIRDGLAWLARDLADETGDNRPRGLPPGVKLPKGARFPMSTDALDDFYFLYGLERACMLAAVSHVGTVAWWEAGAERIVSKQEDSGAFLSASRNNGNGRREIDTCFALLFLKRAVFRTVDKRAVTPSSR